MTTKKLWYEYLSLINEMSTFPGTYGFDQKRVELHNALFEKYCEMEKLFNGIQRERFDKICHNLNKIIDFKPPLKRFESCNVYAKDIDRYMMLAGRHYVTGFSNKL